MNLNVAGGDDKEDIEIRTEQSDISIRSDKNVVGKPRTDRDFANLEKILNAPESVW